MRSLPPPESSRRSHLVAKLPSTMNFRIHGFFTSAAMRRIVSPGSAMLTMIVGYANRNALSRFVPGTALMENHESPSARRRCLNSGLLGFDAVVGSPARTSATATTRAGRNVPAAARADSPDATGAPERAVLTCGPGAAWGAGLVFDVGLFFGAAFFFDGARFVDERFGATVFFPTGRLAAPGFFFPLPMIPPPH